MKYSDVKNPVYANEDKTLVICEVLFDGMAEHVPFGAGKNDHMDHGRKIYEELVAGKYGLIAPYVAPTLSVQELEERAKAKRGAMLEASDWFVLRAFERGEAVPASVRNYRQALRDITKQSGWPFNVDWPSVPVEYPGIGVDVLTPGA